jgi:hypothetical protein
MFFVLEMHDAKRLLCRRHIHLVVMVNFMFPVMELKIVSLMLFVLKNQLLRKRKGWLMMDMLKSNL